MGTLSTRIAISRCALWRRSIYSADGRTDRHATRDTTYQPDSQPKWQYPTQLKAGNCRSIYALQHTNARKKERKRIGKEECRRNLVWIYIRNIKKNIKEWFYALERSHMWNKTMKHWNNETMKILADHLRNCFISAPRTCETKRWNNSEVGGTSLTHRLGLPAYHGMPMEW